MIKCVKKIMTKRLSTGDLYNEKVIENTLQPYWLLVVQAILQYKILILKECLCGFLINLLNKIKI